jgi:hypothetical protein
VLTLIRSVALAAFKTVSAVVVGGAILWEVVLHCGPPSGTVYVHVAHGYGDLTVDDATYHVKTLWETPIVRNVQPGRHIVRMSLDGRLVFEQEFSIGAGEEIVLTAWDSADKGPDSASEEQRLEQF